MTMRETEEYRTAPPSPSVALVLNDRSRAIRLRDRRAEIDRDCHALVLHATRDGVINGPFQDWHWDLRRGRLRVYGSLLRFFDTACKKVPRSVLKMIPGWLSAYIDDLYDEERR